jgi:hypothetical protein
MALRDRIDQASLEDGKILNEIQQMALQRASVVGIRLQTVETDHHTPIVEILKALKKMVYDLAPKFINMDYPYWDLCWAEFPKNYSVVFDAGSPPRRPATVDDISMDEEHNLNIIPQVDTSFGPDNIELYRNFLKNIVYWLEKFRYVNSERSSWDETYERQWEWTKNWDSTTQDYVYAAFEQGQAVANPDASTLTTLKESGQGVIHDTNQYGVYVQYIIVDMNSMRYSSKGYDHGRNTPLVDYEEDDVGIQVPKNISNIPHNVITSNPTGYYAEGLWFVIPYTNGSDHVPTNKTDSTAVTDLNSGIVQRWGNNNQFSGTLYDSAASDTTIEESTFRRNQPKIISYESRQLNTSRTGTYTETKTRWSRDGTESYVYENTTESDSSWPRTTNDYSAEEYVYPTFGGLVPPLTEGVLPCFSMGQIAPHEISAFTVCEMNSLPTDYPIPPIKYPDGETFVWGVGSDCTIKYYGQTRWYPVLDFGEYLTELPDPDEEEVPNP